MDLRSVLQEVYDRGRFDLILPYERLTDPPLDGADAAWARQMIRAWRARS